MLKARSFYKGSLLGAIAAAALFGSPAEGRAATIVLNAAKDNTLFENATGSESNALGDSLFAGRTGVNDNFHIRRALVAFDLSSIPAGSTVTSVSLTLFLAQGAAGAPGSSVSIYSLNGNWGEGTSLGISGNPAPATAGDATWLHRSFNTQLWSTPGGDFDPQASASTLISGAGQTYTWSGAGMVDDVQAWVNSSGSNFGWMLRGNEIATQTAVRFNSRETGLIANRPQLSVTYTVVPEPAAGQLLLPGLIGVMRRRRRV